MEIVAENKIQWLVSCPLCRSKYKIEPKDLQQEREGVKGYVLIESGKIKGEIGCPVCGLKSEIAIALDGEATAIEYEEPRKEEDKPSGIVLTRDKLAYIKNIRKWTNKELAKQLGMSTSSIANWVAGRAQPRTDAALAIDDLYQRTVKYWSKQ